MAFKKTSARRRFLSGGLLLVIGLKWFRREDYSLA
uniref:Uncharacterized protein n=1 Tax=Candidatus Giovannonibacteria bacterium GW2011_GWF2_42_19 TaxID=1618659 RepID=A0A0G1C8I6_9BACT|nr:MAG: hypothetical protein UV11_C0037G0008 [Candidatus Giovannonibacteria bacterium GW2011_GWF2_42_19]